MWTWMRRYGVRVSLGVGVLILVVGGALYIWLFHDLPAPDDLHSYTTAPSSKIYDRYGTLLYEMPPPYTGSHTPVPLSEIPLALRQATIATEDRNFYANTGIDPAGIARAVWYTLRYEDVQVGGSTITQQLVRTLMFTPEERVARTVRRKLREIALAVQITQRYTKDEILAFYLNEVYYGNMAYGVEAAAQAYFGKHVRDLDLAECAMLAGLPQAPALWSPLHDWEAAKARQATVLDLMVEAGYLTPAAAQRAAEEPLAFAATPFPIRAPHFVMYVRGVLERELGLARLQAGGLRIVTTLDVALNETARDLMRTQLALLAVCHHQEECPQGGHNVRNAALLALHPQTGEVLAMVGSPDYFSAAISGAVNGTLALRQPGSSIKPFTYAAAFEQGALTPATMLLDVRTAFVTREGTPYVPLNYDLTFRGPVRAREALAASYNLVAVKVLDTIGIEALTDLTRRLGITTFDDPDRLGLAVTLGGGEVRLVELAAAYAGLANGGRQVMPTVVKRVEDADGNVLWAAEPGVKAQVLDPRVAYLITDILSDDLARLPTFGEGSVLQLSRPAAVKTGTTTDFRDNWTVGYTPALVAGVWVGNADNEAMRDVTGVSGAGPLWHNFMEAALQGQPVQDFARPEGLIEQEVCALSGQLPGPDCPHRVRELFIAGTAPTATCTLHQRIGDEVYVVLPPEAQAWGREQGLPQPPVIERAGGATLFFTSPDQGAVYRLDPTLPRSAQRIAISVSASTDLSHISLFVDGNVRAEFDAPPYTHYWPLVEGVHTFSAEGVDARGATIRSDPVTIEVAPP